MGSTNGPSIYLLERIVDKPKDLSRRILVTSTRSSRNPQNKLKSKTNKRHRGDSLRFRLHILHNHLYPQNDWMIWD